jgi:hypothetical protein
MKTKAAATREQVYAFARKAIELGYGEAAGAAIICFEWLQRPENVLAGFVRWSDYRPAQKPTFLQTEHAKTGAKIWHPLEDDEGNRLYPEAEAVLVQVPRRGPAMILRRVPPPRRRKDAPKTPAPAEVFKPYNAMEMARVVRKVRAAGWVTRLVHARCLPAWWYD